MWSECTGRECPYGGCLSGQIRKRGGWRRNSRRWGWWIRRQFERQRRQNARDERALAHWLNWRWSLGVWIATAYYSLFFYSCFFSSFNKSFCKNFKQFFISRIVFFC